MAGVVIDASVGAKWFLDEEGSSEALNLRTAGHDLVAPDLLLFEVFSSAARAVRRARAPSAILKTIPVVLPTILDHVVPARDLFSEAVDLSLSSGHPIYDCVYLALAADWGLPLITADHKQFAAARQTRIDARLL